MSYDIVSQINKLKVSFETNMKESNPIVKLWCGKQIHQLDNLLKSIEQVKKGEKAANHVAKEIKKFCKIKDFGLPKETKKAMSSFRAELPDILNDIFKLGKENLVWEKTMIKQKNPSKTSVELPRISMVEYSKTFFSGVGLQEWEKFVSNLNPKELIVLEKLLNHQDKPELINSFFAEVSKDFNNLKEIVSESSKASQILEKLKYALPSGMPVTREDVMELFPFDPNTYQRIINKTGEGEENLKMVQSNNSDLIKILSEEKLEGFPKTIEEQIRDVCEIASVLKKKVAPLLSDKQRILHIGSKFSGLPATFELHRKKDGSVETLIKLKLIGKGSFKNVTLTWVFETGASKARAKARLEHPNFSELKRQKEAAEYEEKMLELVKGAPHVIQVEDIVYSRVGKKKHQIMYMDPAKGDLSKLGDKLTSAQKDKVALEFLEGMVELDKRNIVHRDLKPENILLFSDPKNPKELEAKIIDFGLAKHAPLDSPEWKKMQKEFAGTMPYMSPEMWRRAAGYTHPPITSKTDVWAGGCILWTLFEGKPPPWIKYMQSDPQGAVSLLNSKNNLPEPQNKETREWIAWKMLRPDSADRYTFEQAFNHLKQIVAKDQKKSKR